MRDAVVEKVVDGDTIALLVDMGFSLFARYRCRVMLDDESSIDTPERGQPGYHEAIEHARTLLSPNDRVVVESLRFVDKYGGRFDGRLFLPAGGNFAEAMVVSGHARVWRYGDPKPFARAGA